MRVSTALLVVLSMCALVSVVSGSTSETLPVMAGYDLVEYHNLDPLDDGVQGDSKYSHLHTNGYLYYFKDEINLNKFRADPAKYLPQYGGFCAWGTAYEYAEDGWPWAANHQGPPCGPQDGWAIIDGKLYCSIWRSYQDDFNLKAPESIRIADQRWIEWFGSLEAGPQNNGCYAWNYALCLAATIFTPSPGGPRTPATTVAPANNGLAAGSPITIADGNYTANMSQVHTALSGSLQYNWTITNLTSTNTEDHQLQLTLTTLTAGDVYAAFGFADTLMEGPMTVVYVDPSTSRGQVSTWSGEGFTTKPRVAANIKVIMAKAFPNGTWTATVAGPVHEFGGHAFTTQRTIFAKGTYVSTTNTPLPHPNGLEGRSVGSINLYSVVTVPAGVAVPVGATPAPTAAASRELPAVPGSQVTQGAQSYLDSRVRVDYRVFHFSSVVTTAPNHIVEVSLTSTRLDYFVGFGFAEKWMQGWLVTCGLTNGNQSVQCQHWEGVGINMVPMKQAPVWHLMNSTISASSFSVTIRGILSEVNATTVPSTNGNSRGVLAIGRQTTEEANRNPLIHFTNDRTAVYFNVGASGSVASGAGSPFHPRGAVAWMVGLILLVVLV